MSNVEKTILGLLLLYFPSQASQPARSSRIVTNCIASLQAEKSQDLMLTPSLAGCWSFLWKLCGDTAQNDVFLLLAGLPQTSNPFPVVVDVTPLHLRTALWEEHHNSLSVQPPKFLLYLLILPAHLRVLVSSSSVDPPPPQLPPTQVGVLLEERPQQRACGLSL